ncbi:MAG TPA: hypothetical protein VIT42_10710 [Microlunatus sp.]
MTDPSGAADEVVVSGRVLAQLVEALGHLERFLTSSDTSRAELVEYCYPRPGLTSAGLVDQLAWQHLYLRTRLAEEASPARHSEPTGQEHRHG